MYFTILTSQEVAHTLISQRDHPNIIFHQRPLADRSLRGQPNVLFQVQVSVSSQYDTR